MDSKIFSVFRGKTFIGDRIGDDTIVINTETGAYYSLTPAAGNVWANTENGQTSVPRDDWSVAKIMVLEGILVSPVNPHEAETGDASIAFVKYTEMADILLADPIHEVDSEGWPKLL
jgi:hypothetical protein